MATGSCAGRDPARGGVDGTLTGLRHSRRREAFLCGGVGSTPTGEPSGEPSTRRARGTTILWCPPPALWPADARSGRTRLWGWAQLAAMRPVMVRASPRSTPLSGALVVGLTPSGRCAGDFPRSARRADSSPPGRAPAAARPPRIYDPRRRSFARRLGRAMRADTPGAVSPAPDPDLRKTPIASIGGGIAKAGQSPPGIGRRPRSESSRRPMTPVPCRNRC